MTNYEETKLQVFCLQLWEEARETKHNYDKERSEDNYMLAQEAYTNWQCCKDIMHLLSCPEPDYTLNGGKR